MDLVRDGDSRRYGEAVVDIDAMIKENGALCAPFSCEPFHRYSAVTEMPSKRR